MPAWVIISLNRSYFCWQASIRPSLAYIVNKAICALRQQSNHTCRYHQLFYCIHLACIYTRLRHVRNSLWSAALNGALRCRALRYVAVWTRLYRRQPSRPSCWRAANPSILSNTNLPSQFLLLYNRIWDSALPRRWLTREQENAGKILTLSFFCVCYHFLVK